MADAEKPDSSTGKGKSKISFLDEDISKDFFSSWKSMSVTGGDDMDFNFEPVAKGKNKAFDFGMDMDFSLDDAFGKMPSFKLDMPDIDFSCSPKKSSKSKEKKSEGESAEGSRHEKNDKFTFSFDFNGDGDIKESREIRSKMVSDASPCAGQEKKDALDLVDNKKTSIDTKTSGGGPSSEGNGEKLHDSPSSCGKEVTRQDSAVEKSEKNNDVSRDDDDENENVEISTQIVADSVPDDGQAEKDELHLLDNRKLSTDTKSSSRDKESLFVEVFGKIPSCKLDMPVININSSLKKSPLLKEKQPDEPSAKGDHQQKSIKLSSPLPTAEAINATPISEKEAVDGVVESLGNDYVTLDTVACSETNISKTMNSEAQSNAEMKMSGLKDSPAQSDSEPTHAKPISTQCQLSGANNASAVLGVNDGAVRKLATLWRNKKGSTPSVTAGSGGDLSNGLGGEKMDDNSNSCAKELLKQKSDVDKKDNSADVLRDVNNDDNDEIRSKMVAHPVPHDGQSKKDGLRFFNTKMSIDKKSAGIRLPSLVAPRGISNSSNEGNEKLKGKISITSTVQQSNVGQVNRIPSARVDKIMPTLPSLRISRNITPNKKSSSVIVKDANAPMRNLEKSPRLQVKSRMVSPLNVQKQTPSMPSLKRKSAEAADLLHPSKRLSPSDSMYRKSKGSAREAENEVRTQCILVEGSKANVPAENLSPKFDFSLEENMENLGFTLMESDANVEKAEACAKELDDICSMLKKKHDEAKELLVRALVNNNDLLMLNHPIYEEKIRKVQRFASRLMSRQQEAGV